MIELALRLLALSDFRGEYIDIAKGKNKIPTSFREGIKHATRWRKN